ncbi:MAG: hypothetical protein KIT84_44735 [Labilithrix sp.]|nr:hypothetical protein [Labilithrix sp.]
MLRRSKSTSVDLGVVLPKDLARLLDTVGGGAVADFRGRPTLPRLGPLLTAARKGGAARERLVALLAGAIPFGETTDGEVLAYFHGEDPAATAVIATVDPPQVVCRGAGELAVICMMHALNAEPPVPVPGIAEEGAVRLAIERGEARAALLLGADADVRATMRALAGRTLDVPPPETRADVRSSPLAFGALVESFFRGGDLAAHASSADALVRELALLLAKPEYARRAALAPKPRRASAANDALTTTRLIVDRIDALPPAAEAFGAVQEREETLLALAALGDRAVLPELRTRAIGGDPQALEMLGVLGDRELTLHATELLAAEGRRVPALDVALVRMLVAVGATEACPALRRLLETSPLTGWRQGLERGVVVRELVVALGELGDRSAAPLLVTILESKSQEYRAMLPLAAYSLGQLEHEPALAALERFVLSPKDAVACEAIWAIGAIGRAHAAARPRAAALLELLRGLEPGAEVTRLVALAKVGQEIKERDLRAAIDRALVEPGFRQDETSRRRAWAFRALEDLAAQPPPPRSRRSALVFDYEAMRYWVTRDDHRVRCAAERAFAAFRLPAPKARPYFAFALPDDVDALLEAVRDPLGIFKHNVATRLAALDDRRAVRALAEATARLFAAPATSTYEYDDAPPPLVAFVRALAKVNDQESNGVLLEGLRSQNHQVRAVVAENAPDDARFVPELMEMLGDPRSFLRSRAEKSLTTLGAIQPHVEPMTTELMAVPQRLQG